MELIPFGQVLDDRVEISKKYYLIEVVNGIWRLTKKCKDNYNQFSYFQYLRGKIEKPIRISDPIPKQPKQPKQQPITKPAPERVGPPFVIKSYHEDPQTAQLIDQIFDM